MPVVGCSERSSVLLRSLSHRVTIGVASTVKSKKGFAPAARLQLKPKVVDLSGGLGGRSIDPFVLS